MAEIVIPFIDTVAEESKPAVTQFIANSGATTEEIANFKSLDEFLSGYKPKAQGDWTTSLEAEHKALLGVKGWKTPGDAIKGYSELEKLVGHEKIAMPKKDANGNYEAGELDRVMAQLGRPKDPKEYKPSANFKLPDGMAIDAKFMEGFNSRLHKAGFLPHQYALVMDELALVLNQGTQAQKDANEKAFNEAALNLRNKFGLAYPEKEKLANNVLRTFADQTQGDAIAKKYGNDPLIIEILANIGESLSEEALIRTNMSGTLLSPEAAKLEKENIMADSKHPYYLAEHPQHQYWVNKVMELNKMIIGE